jgi:hypothetical protein
MLNCPRGGLAIFIYEEGVLMIKISVSVCVVSLLSFIIISYGYPACEGDLNCSGTVDGSDLALLAADFGTTGCGNCDDVVARIDELENRIAQLEELLQHITSSDTDIYIDGANLHIRNGTNSTNGLVNGLGNLIVGYNEERGGGEDNRTGSHNIVVGIRQNYSSYGGIVAGWFNNISAGYASVLGGTNNTASGSAASVSGGNQNAASGLNTSVSGGSSNTADGRYSSISGGNNNDTFGDYSSISGGYTNTADGERSSISGGYNNTASANYVSISGGSGNTASALYASISGGSNNTASGSFSHVSGGRYNTASGDYSFVGGGGHDEYWNGNEAYSNYSAILGGYSNNTGDDRSNPPNRVIGGFATVSGGMRNNAIGWASSVSGGNRNEASGDFSSISGGNENTVSGSDASAIGDSGKVYVDNTLVH